MKKIILTILILIALFIPLVLNVSALSIECHCDTYYYCGCSYYGREFQRAIIRGMAIFCGVPILVLISVILIVVATVKLQKKKRTNRDTL